MAEWNYQREENEVAASLAGKRRCVITAVEETVSKSSGKPMIVITVRPSGCRFTVKSYLVANDNFNRNATALFDAFPDIGEGNFNFIEWVGCVGAAMFKESDRGYLEVAYWISYDRATSLPAFEGDVPERQTVTKFDEDEADDDGDIPF